MVQLITGHNFLTRHNTIVELGEVDKELAACRFCQQDDESSFHILAECDYFARLRMEIFLTHRIEANELANKDFSTLKCINFLQNTGITEFTDILDYDPLAPSE